MKTIGLIFLSLVATENLQAQHKQYQFSDSELKLLEEGIISDDRRTMGGLLGSVVGFGTGHIVTGQWDEMGWLFTGGEALSIAALGYGISHGMTDEGTTAMAIGLVGLVGFRAFEIYDIWTRPNLHNEKVRSLQSTKHPQLSFGILPTDEGLGAAINLKF